MSFFNKLWGAQILQVFLFFYFLFSVSLWVFLLWSRLYVRIRIGKFVFFLLQIHFVCWVTQFDTSLISKSTYSEESKLNA
jgi:hypothetical protein